MDTQEQILAFMAQQGPVLPGKVAKLINTNILLASAHLSDLAAQGKVKISYLKIGGSPLYYLSGQEEQLEQYAPSNLNPKDVAVMERLKQEKILREAELELLPRVALRSLKDFAVQLSVRTPQGSELFWKWHSVLMPEANERIANILNRTQETPAKTAESLSSASMIQSAPLSSLPAEAVSPSVRQEQQTLPSKLEERNRRRSPRKKVEEEFLPTLHAFFKERHIQVEEQQLLRKNTEAIFMVSVPSVVGKMKYFCRAKRKNNCDEKDLSSAYMEAQMKRIPLLFLYSGQLSKKAKEMIEAGAFENAIIKKMEEEK